MKKFISILMSITITFSVMSCKESKHELEKLAVVLAVGFDLTPENDYEVTVQILNPQKESGGSMGGGKSKVQQGGLDVLIASSTGVTPGEAVARLSTTIGRELYWAHNKFTVLGESLSQAGLAFYIDAVLRNHQTRPDIPLLVAKGKASSIISAVASEEKIPAVSIERLLETQSVIGYAPVISRVDFINTLSGKSKAPIAGVIDFKQNEITGNNLALAGTAVFKRDKLIGYLDMNETRGLNWIRGKVKAGIIVSALSDGSRIVFEILKSSSKVYPIVNGDKITIEIDINEEGNIKEMTAELDPMKNPKIMEELSQIQDMAIRQEVELALHKAQKELDVDIFNFASVIHKNYPKMWIKMEKSWGDTFSNVKTKVKVNSVLKRPGVISKPIK